MNRPGCLFSLGCLNTNMQLKTVVPDETTSTAIFRQIKRQDDRFAPFAHWQNNSPVLMADCLSRPFDWIEAFLSPGIFHLHLGVSLAKLACGIDVGKKGVYNHLDR